jgi:hypothetical protein
LPSSCILSNTSQHRIRMVMTTIRPHLPSCSGRSCGRCCSRR